MSNTYNCGCDHDCDCDCEQPINCIQQAVNDALAGRIDELDGYADRAETGAENAEASATDAANSATQAGEYRDQSQVILNSAQALVPEINETSANLQETAEIVQQLVLNAYSYQIVKYPYTVLGGESTITVPDTYAALTVQSIIAEGITLQAQTGDFTFDSTSRVITLTQAFDSEAAGTVITVQMGQSNAESPETVLTALASTSGAGLVGTSDGVSVQVALNNLNTNKVSKTELAASNGLTLIGRCADVATLRTIEPTVAGQRIDVVAYYSGWASNVNPIGGGYFFYDAADITSTDDGVICFVTTGGKRWKRIIDGRITPLMAGAYGDGVINDAAALVAASNVCLTNKAVLDGIGLTYAINSTVSLSGGNFENLNIVPAPGYLGSGVSFLLNPSTAMIKLKNLTIKGFKGYGAKALINGYVGTPTLILHGCSFDDNGNLKRTTCINAVNTASDYIIPVADASIFAVNDYVWIGDSRCQIESISGNSVTLVNNGSAPTLSGGGVGTGSYLAGQYFTKDGDGMNGLTVGNAGGSWNIVTEGRNTFNNNGWFGLFLYTNSAIGNLQLKGCEANNNGYCGLGCGYVASGLIQGNTANGNGNNGIDVFQCNAALKFHGNNASNNGVDGIFSGAVATSPTFSENTCADNHRIGILAYGRTTAPVSCSITDNLLTGNQLYSLGITSVYSALIKGNTLGGGQQGIHVEGRNGLLNPQGIVISNNFFPVASSNQDIYANIGGYTSGGDAGSIKIIDNGYFGRAPIVFCSGFSTKNSKFIPQGKLGFTETYTAVAGAAINIALTFAKMSNTTLVDPTAGMVEMQFGATSAFLATATVDSATRTAGIEVSNTATSNGKILVMANAGSIGYSFVSTTARTVYLLVKTPYGDGVITLTWS